MVSAASSVVWIRCITFLCRSSTEEVGEEQAAYFEYIAEIVTVYSQTSRDV